VDVQARQVGAEAVLSVTDSGPGIPAEERERVFDRFYRGSQATAHGSGLGLAIVKRIADRYRARIALSAAESGSGLCVTVRAPIMA
jgi:signal transduction histidine kinase